MLILRSFVSAILLVTITGAIPVAITEIFVYEKPPIDDKIFIRDKSILSEISNIHADPFHAEILARVELQNGDVTSEAESVPKKIDYRLPKNVIPINYSIELEPHLIEGDFTYNGVTIIDILVKEIVKNITLHAIDLTFIDTSLVSVDEKKTFKPTNFFVNDVKQFITLEFDEEIIAGNYKLKLEYVGTLRDGPWENGFYKSSYINENNEKVYFAVTHFEPTHARRAFPCFDEPALKAHFKISIKHFKNYTALSNMPAIKSTKKKDTANEIWTHFEITPPMSTYLVAFAISDFENLSNKEGTFNVWAQKTQIKNGKYALEVGQKQLELLEEYMSSKYVLPKMDVFSVPGMGSAMENWGLVTFGEQSLLCNETSESMMTKETITQLIAHEFAHQWFGNLVTPTWWEYTWLKEGFASYFENFIPNKIMPNSRFMDRYVVWNIQTRAFGQDDYEFQHAMNSPVESPEEIRKNYDQIAYTKAACVIRMFSHITGEEAFQKGLQKLLKNKEYSTATPDDLFDSLLSVVEDSTLKKEMRDSFNSWVTQPGYPVVSTKHSEYDRINLTSKRFFTKKPISDYPPEKWWIPISIATEDKPIFNDTKLDIWHISGETTGYSVNLSKWYIINKQQTGYYRVNYDLSNWKLLAKYLRTKDYYKIHLFNRAQLLDDSYNLARSGDLQDYNAFFDISTYLKQEDDIVAWDPAFRAFTTLEKFLRHTAPYDLFKQYIVKLIAKLEESTSYNQLPEDSSFIVINKMKTLVLACLAGSKICRDATQKDVVAYINGKENSLSFLRNYILCAGMRSANATIWNKAFELFEKKNDIFILTPLGCSSDSEIIKAYLEKVIVPETKISQYASKVLYAVSDGSVPGLDIAFDFVQKNLAAINKTLGGETFLSYYIIDLAKGMNTKTQMSKLIKFIESLPIENKDLAEKLKTEALGDIEENIKWGDKYIDQIAKFLEMQELIEPPLQPAAIS